MPRKSISNSRNASGYSRRFVKKGKNRSWSKPSVGVIRSPSAVTDEMRVALTYSTHMKLSSGIAPAFHIMRGNSLFDPDFTGLGHQPLGYDQWKGFYDSYMVTGCGYKCTFIGNGGKVSLAAVICKPNSAGLTNFNTIRERAYENTILLGEGGSNKHIQTITGYMSTAKIFGLQKVNQRNADYSAGTGGNPVSEWFIHIYGQALDRITAVDTDVEIKLTYYCKFYNRANLQQS